MGAGDWWIRLSIDLEHTKDVEAALQTAEAALKDPWVKHGDRLDLQVYQRCTMCACVFLCTRIFVHVFLYMCVHVMQDPWVKHGDRQDLQLCPCLGVWVRMRVCGFFRVRACVCMNVFVHV